ncbi:MAG: sulfotransferase [Armatimonadetes bacterium]|nr:sulfotransferase [Armatimonadota bacterium]
MARHQLLIHPRFSRLPPPVIVIGMHRSGTSLVAAMLEALGVYMGSRRALSGGKDLPAPDEWLLLNGYAEADDFRQLNDLLLARAGAAWNRIEPFLARRERPGFARTSIALLQLATFTRLRSHYLRPLPATFHGPWGWKDPRTSMTLPYWLRLFPQARILHVRRDQEAVVDSLHRRAHVWRQAAGAPLPVTQRARWWLLHPWGTLKRAARRAGLSPAAAPDPCQDRDYCRYLCQLYVQECLRYREHGDRYLEVGYEDILAAPAWVVGELVEFTGGAPSPSDLLRAAALVQQRTTRGRVLGGGTP